MHHVEHHIGVCSWSLRPSDPEDLARKVDECGFSEVQIALDPLRRGDWNVEETVQRLRDRGVSVLSGMMAMRGEDYSTLQTIRNTGGVRLEQYWEENLASAHANAEIANAMGIGLVTFHAGFLPHDLADPIRSIMLDRLRSITDAFAAQGINVALETGQETAATLCDVLRELDRPTIGVNFDPGNMILYGMGDPVASLAMLADWVRQIHIKDAQPTKVPGTWGCETPVGQGCVNWPAFLQLATERTPRVNLVIERESGDHAIKDVRTAAALVRAHVSIT